MFKIIRHHTHRQMLKDAWYVKNIKRLMRGEKFNSPAGDLEEQVRAEAVGDFERIDDADTIRD